MAISSCAGACAGYNIAAAKEPVITKFDELEYYPIENETTIECATYCIVEVRYAVRSEVSPVIPESFETDDLSFDILNNANRQPRFDMIVEITPQLDSDQPFAWIHLAWDEKITQTITSRENQPITFIRKANV